MTVDNTGEYRRFTRIAPKGRKDFEPVATDLANRIAIESLRLLLFVKVAAFAQRLVQRIIILARTYRVDNYLAFINGKDLLIKN